MIHYLIFDTETTGLPKKNDFSLINMIELGYIILDEDFKIVKESNNLVKGDFEIPEIITKLTGITKNKIDENGNDINKVLKEFINDIRSVDYILAHNNRFDLGILKKEMERLDNSYYFKELVMKKINLDTIQIFKKNIKKEKIENYKLQTIFNHFYNKEDFIQTHRAIDDCHMVYKSLLYMKNNNNFCMNEYFLNKQMNFGKYKKIHNLKYIYKYDQNYFKFIFNEVYKINPIKFLKFL
jgi:DNA polymerase III epsilon subunit-like protein